MAIILSGATCHEAWVSVCNHLINHPQNHDTNLFVEIESPCDFTNLNNWVRNYNPDKYVSNAGKIRHVVNTIFPYGLKSFYSNRQDFYAKYSNIFSKSTNKSWGTYFQRLIAFGKGCSTDSPNQLENAIKALSGKAPQKYFITFHLTASNIESNVRPLGPPCWQYGELIVNEKGEIDLIAVYRNHDYHDKALGNFIGLAKLLEFICAESGRQKGRLLIHSIHAYSSQPVSKLARLLIADNTLNLSNGQAGVIFDSLIEGVLKCTKCSRMCNSQRVLNRSSGSVNADIMFVGEAPGRLGADGTGIPFHGDKSGHNFEELLHFAGLGRADIFVTNAVLCNPKDENGNNATPTQNEIKNCSEFLQKQIELVNPKIIVTLGASSLAALKNVSVHNAVLRDSVRTKIQWFNRILIPLYHPGQRAMISRSFANQRSDYQFIADQFKQVNKAKKISRSSKSQLSVALIIDYLFSKKSSYTYFALHKLFYLIEYKSVQELGHRLTNSYIIRQKDGPYCTDLHLFKLQKALPYIKVKHLSKTNILLFRLSTNLFDDRLIDQFEIDQTAKELIDRVFEEHAGKSNAAIKRTVYFTRPMRNILLLEMREGMNLYNTAIEF